MSRAAALVGAAVAITGCGESRRAPPPPPDPTAACVAALPQVARLPGHERTAALLRGCAVCGPSFTPLLEAVDGYPDLAATIELVNRCQLGCSNRAIGRWRALYGDVVPGHGASRPWRALAEDCPAAMATTDATARYASAPWLALVQIGQRLRGATDPAVATVIVPLPPWSVVGTGVSVPTGRRAPGTPWRQLTVTAQGLHLARLPYGQFRDGWTVAIDAAPYPGVAVGADLAATLATLGAAPVWPDVIEDVVVVAPQAMAAPRVFAALRALAGTPARLAVAAPDPAWPGAIAAHVVRWMPITGPRVRLDAVGRRVAVVDAAGATVTAMRWPDGADDRARLAAVTAAAGRAPLELHDGFDGDVAALVGLLDALAAPASAVALAPVGATVGDDASPPWDAAAFATALAKAAQP